MNRMLLFFIAAALFCIPALSPAAFDSYSGITPRLNAQFTFENYTTWKTTANTFQGVTTLKTVKFALRAVPGKKNIGLSRDIALNFLGAASGGAVYVKVNKGVLALSPMNQILTAANNISITNFTGEIYCFTGTADWDPATSSGTGTGRVYKASIGGLLTFTPAKTGTSAKIKLKEISARDAAFFNMSSGVVLDDGEVDVDKEVSAMAWTISVPVISVNRNP